MTPRGSTYYYVPQVYLKPGFVSANLVMLRLDTDADKAIRKRLEVGVVDGEL